MQEGPAVIRPTPTLKVGRGAAGGVWPLMNSMASDPSLWPPALGMGGVVSWPANAFQLPVFPYNDRPPFRIALDTPPPNPISIHQNCYAVPLRIISSAGD